MGLLTVHGSLLYLYPHRSFSFCRTVLILASRRIISLQKLAVSPFFLPFLIRVRRHHSASLLLPLCWHCITLCQRLAFKIEYSPFWPNHLLLYRPTASQPLPTTNSLLPFGPVLSLESFCSLHSSPHFLRKRRGGRATSTELQETPYMYPWTLDFCVPPPSPGLSKN